MMAEDLTEPSWQCITFLSRSQAEALDAGIGQVEVRVLTVDAWDVLSHEALLDKLGEIFEFPDYYGRNYNALDDCLRDLSWLPAPAYALRVREAGALWCDGPEVGGALVESWLLAAEHWARQGVAFHLLFLW
jgi:barstar (barnase inhibitor)